MPSFQELLLYFKDPGLFFSFLLIALVAVISMVQDLRLERDLLFSTIRGFFQLSVVGFLLSWIFSFQSLWIVALVLLGMSLWASLIARKRGAGIPHVFEIVWLALFLSVSTVLSLLVLGRSVRAEPQILIPLGGMILGNSMNGAGLTLNRLQSEIQLKKPQILACLSLGASPRQAIQEILETVLAASLIPAIDTTKALGVISIPGMMAGMIIAGQSPLLAVRYQIIVMFMLLAGAALTNLIVLLLAYRQFFTSHAQLKLKMEG